MVQGAGLSASGKGAATPVALVTGASRGVGAAISARLADRGYHLVLIARDAPGLSRIRHELGPKCPSILSFSLDIGSYDDLEAAFQVIRKEKGHLDLLINNAGVGFFDPIATMEPSIFETVFRTNLTGTFHCIQLAVPLLVTAPTPLLINVASTASRIFFPGGGAYCASKLGLRALTTITRQELAPRNIRVVTLLPGAINTTFGGRSPTEPWKLQPSDIVRVIDAILDKPSHLIPAEIETEPYFVL